MAFTHLHVHSTYSLLEASCTVDQLVEKAVSQGCGALALTDENHCAGLFEFYQACNKKKIKPILGMQINVTGDMKVQKDDEVNKSVILLVKNKVGWKNLCILSSEAYISGFHYTPRIDYGILQKHSEGLILLTGGTDGHLANHILYNRLEKAKALLQWYKKTFGDDVYVEIMFHPSPDKPFVEKMEKQIYETSLKLADEVGIKCICTNDVRYCNKTRKEVKSQEILTCIKQHKVAKDDTRKSLTCPEYYMKTREELESLFPIRDDLFDNTIEIVNKIENSIIETGMDLLPVFKTSDGSDPSIYLRNLVYDGLKKKNLFEKQEYRDRADWELRVFETCGFVNYFLVLHEFVNWAREKGIAMGPGRGCFLPNNKVDYEDGKKYIKDISIGDKVLAYDGKYHEVVNKMCYDINEEIIEINMEDGRKITCTSDHKIHVKRVMELIWIKAKDLTENDEIYDIETGSE